ncbi:hypothetical protein [Vibrio fluvialis]|uniref:hypothetical protein n=1 Tax=Vibrio fluvialis TaxID=676 RepID=UPI003D7DBDDE
MKKITVEQASKKFPVGAKVKFFPIAGIDKFEETEVTSEPWCLCGETVVKVKCRAGGVSANHLELI